MFFWVWTHKDFTSTENAFLLQALNNAKMGHFQCLTVPQWAWAPPFFISKLNFPYDKYSVDKVGTKIYCHFYFRGITLRSCKIKAWKKNQAWTGFEPMPTAILVPCCANCVKPTSSTSHCDRVRNIPVDDEECIYYIFELRRKISKHDRSSQLYTKLKQLWN